MGECEVAGRRTGGKQKSTGNRGWRPRVFTLTRVGGHEVIRIYVANARGQAAIFRIVIEIAIANGDYRPGIGGPVTTKIEDVAGIDGTAVGPVGSWVAASNRVCLAVR